MVRTMKKINIIKENRDFNRIIRTGKPFKYKNYIIYVEKRESNVYKFGFSVGKKIGNAVMRNRIKRQLKSIVDKYEYHNNFNCIIIVCKGILNNNYLEMQESLHEALSRLKLLKEK